MATRSLAPLAIFLLGFALRVTYVHQVRHTPVVEVLLNDADYYHRWASGALTLKGQPYFMSPGYPTALDWFYRVAGVSVNRALLAQAVVGALVPLLVMGWAGRAFGAGAGRAAGVLTACYPPLIVYDEALLTALPINLFNMAALALLAWPGYATALAAGLCLGASALCRPNVLLWAVALGGWWIVARPLGRESQAKALATSGLLLWLGIIGLLLPVALRNYREAGQFTLTVASGGMNFWTGNHAGANGTYQGAPFIFTQEPGEEAAGFLDEAARRLGRPVTSAEASSFWMGEAWRWIRSDPAGWIRLLARKAYLFWRSLELPGNLSYDFGLEFSSLARSIPLNFALLGALGLAGLWLSRAAWRDQVPALTCLAVYAATNIGFFTLAQYRLPVVPVLAGFGGLALARLWAAARGRGSWAGLPVALGLGLISILVSLSPDPESDALASRRINYLNAGTGYARGGQNLKAIAMWEAALRIDPFYALARGQLEAMGARAYKARDYDLSVAAFRAQMAGGPPDAYRIAYNLGRVLERAGRNDEAAAAYRQALALEPRYAPAAKRLAALSR